MKKELALFAVLAIIMLASPAHADNFAVDISDINITPDVIYSGDLINVTVSFSVGSPPTALPSVKLSFFFDGEVKDSHIAAYLPGQYSHTFHYSLDPNKNLNRKIMVTAKVYQDGTLKDEDSVTQDIYIKLSTGVHELGITSVKAPGSVDAGSEFPVTVSIKNRGDTREDNVQTAILLNKKLYYAAPASIPVGETAERVITLRAPESAGNYDIEAQVANAYNMQTQKSSVHVSALFLSLSLSKPAAAVNEWVGVSGYATRDGRNSAGSVQLFRDGIYIGAIPATENGYYSTSIKFDSAGTHLIEAKAGDMGKSQYIYISAPETAGAPKKEAASVSVPPPENYTAIIIIDSGGTKVIYPATGVQRGKYEGFSFVEAGANVKELDIVQNRGNTFRVSVTNHLGRSGLFGIGTDFNEKWVFLPKSEVLLDGESRAFDVYFSPDEQGRFSGSIYILEGANITKSIPLSLFITPPMLRKSWIPEISGLELAGILEFAAVIFAAGAVIYLAFRKQKALEPLGFAPIMEAQESAAAYSKAAMPQAEEQGFFQVPLEKIIM